MAKVSFLGLGVMGYPMAGHLQNSGMEVCVYNRTTKKAEDWVRQYGGAMALSPADATRDCDLVMTIDGSMQIYADLDEVVDTLWEDGLDMVIATHPKRDCVYQEALAVLQKGFDSAISVGPQMWRYFLQGYPANNGMYGTRMMIKNNRSENLRYMCEVWSQEYRSGSCRDQLSLNHAIWKTRRQGLELNIKAVDFDWLYKESGMFGIRLHNR